MANIDDTGRKAPPEKPAETPGSPSATTSIDGKYLPPPPPKFGGVINLSAEQSKPFWPPTVVPPKGGAQCFTNHDR